ncbi:hypothetical protein EDD22DRAFT_913648 [Suillus occidentalis]|nr:hypothetical protein EDD22DRAFT_913648 [Suillus occidentalis]
MACNRAIMMTCSIFYSPPSMAVMTTYVQFVAHYVESRSMVRISLTPTYVYQSNRREMVAEYSLHLSARPMA